MSAKTSAARRAAFFEALAETGNRTLAAERAKVSQSWVTLHRGQDPEFRRAMEEALRRARDRLGRHPERRPPSGWGYLDGAELVVRGSNGRRLQIARARLKQWTPRVEERFLRALLATCNVKASLAEAGMSPASAYAHRKRWPAFARRWDDAVAESFARIEAALIENGCNLFSGAELPLDQPLKGMDVDQAIRLVHMHKNGVLGLGKAPGRGWRPPARFDEAMRASILRKLSAFERARRLGEGEKAEAEREYARRRERGAGQEG